ncbi:ABC transporter substrate-binding protein [Halapricum salinum]|uniref:Extracellular solute-binding protein n=1 Tax=Halapricum salinum TaxID=1457250 RepID=A0A4D6HBR2_9EURY|nr:substrate-binding domain-containing protein [Halapricum salinum]QCC50666.1 hypothetical protein DV733_05145 [Halapricum salinum]
MTNRPNHDRRTFLKIGGLSAAVVTAGCLGGDNDESGAETTPDRDQDPEEWRAEKKEQAREELSGDKLQVWIEGASSEDIERSVYNGHPVDSLPESMQGEPLIPDGSPWEPLKDNVEVIPLNSQEQASRYRREQQSGNVTADILTTVYLPRLISRDIPLANLSGVPGWQENVPEELQSKTSRIGYYQQQVYGTFYNSSTVESAPETLLDLLDPQFSDDSIILDVTPNPASATPFIGEEYVDSVPPRLEAVDSDMTGGEFIEALANQNPKFDESAYGMTLDTAQGGSDITFLGPLSVMYDQQAEGLPIEPLEHPSGYVFVPSGIGVPDDPPHPNAAKLFADYLLSTRGAQVFQKGIVTADFEMSNPQGALDWLYADWQQPYAQLDIDRDLSEVESEWKDYFGVPNV